MATLRLLMSGCIVLALLNGCVSSKQVKLVSEVYRARSDDYAIDVYVPVDAAVEIHQATPNAIPTSKLPPNATIIARIDGTGAALAGWGAMIEDAKKRARAVGGDGIIVGQSGQHLAAITEFGA